MPQAPLRGGGVTGASQSWRCLAAPTQTRQRRVSCILLFLSLSGLAEPALAGAAIANAEAHVAPGASPTQTKASLHTKEVNSI